MRASWEESEQIRNQVLDYLRGHPEGAAFYQIDAAVEVGGGTFRNNDFRKVDRALQTLRRLGKVEHRRGKWYVR
jgi:hypothetical protein